MLVLAMRNLTGLIRTTLHCGVRHKPDARARASLFTTVYPRLHVGRVEQLCARGLVASSSILGSYLRLNGSAASHCYREQKPHTWCNRTVMKSVSRQSHRSIILTPLIVTPIPRARALPRRAGRNGSKGRFAQRMSVTWSFVVIRLHEPHCHEASNTLSRRWPYPELEQLLKAESAHRSGTGARQVLVVGTDCGELTTWLKALGLEVTLFDETVREPSTACQNGTGFELVFAAELHSPQGNLLDISSRARTACLLAQLRPSGRLFVFSSHAAEPSGRWSVTQESDSASERPSVTGGHRAACWVRHLACFPGHVQTKLVRSSPHARSAWHWLFGAGVPPGESDKPALSIVSLLIPAEPVAAAGWQDHVRRGLLTGSACCELALPTTSLQHRAA